MAAGEFDVDPTEATDKTPLIDRTGDDDDDDLNNMWNQMPEEERQQLVEGAKTPQDTDTTQPFEPGAASTSYGEQVPMATRTRLPQEQQGSRTEETSFITGDTQGQRLLTTEEMAFDEVKEAFPSADRNQLNFRYKLKPRSGGAIIQVNYHTRDTWYDMYTKSRGDAEKTLAAKLSQEIKDALGKSVTEEFNEPNATLEANQKELKAKQKQKQQMEQRAADAQKFRRDMDALRNKIKETDDQIQEMEDAHGPLDTEAIQRLKNEKRNLESEHHAKRKELDNAQKAAQEADKLQKDIDKLMLDSRGYERRLEELRAKKDAVKPLDELKQNKEELERQNAEDRLVIEAEDTSPSEREAAEARVAEREEELARVNTEIEVRERGMSLRERVREIFKKYGWTLQAIVLAAGITISAVVLATLNGLARATKAIGNGLKELGKKAANALPGLIGSIVSFIFKAAGLVISFLGEHAWLLILAVVAFLVERVTKRSRS